MVVNQPTWGVDAGAAARIRQALIELARSGSAVLVISQDLDELFEISDCDRRHAWRRAVEAAAARRSRPSRRSAC